MNTYVNKIHWVITAIMLMLPAYAMGTSPGFHKAKWQEYNWINNWDLKMTLPKLWQISRQDKRYKAIIKDDAGTTKIFVSARKGGRPMDRFTVLSAQDMINFEYAVNAVEGQTWSLLESSVEERSWSTGILMKVLVENKLNNTKKVVSHYMLSSAKSTYIFTIKGPEKKQALNIIRAADLGGYAPTRFMTPLMILQGVGVFLILIWLGNRILNFRISRYLEEGHRSINELGFMDEVTALNKHNSN